MISLEALEKNYQSERSLIPVLKRVSLVIEPGIIQGVIGQKGSGKTTLLRCIAQLEKPNFGTIEIDHYAFSDQNQDTFLFVRQFIGMLTAETHLLDSKTVYENVALPLELVNTPKSEIHAIIKPLLNLVGLADKATAYPKSLNLAEKKRVALARALVKKPKILLCDEPVQDIEPKSALAFLQLLKEVNDRFKISMLICTQDIDVVKTLCHRAAILHQGEIIEENTTRALFVKPQSSLAKEWVKASTRLELPTALRRRLKQKSNESLNPVLRLAFSNADPNEDTAVSNPAKSSELSKEAIIAHIVQHFQLNIHIMQAHLEPLRDETISVMIIEVQDPNHKLEEAIQFLENQELFVEVLGYATRTY